VSTTAPPIGKPDLPAPPTSKQWQKNERSSKNWFLRWKKLGSKKSENYLKLNNIKNLQ
jgi:hypothetical protein